MVTDSFDIPLGDIRETRKPRQVVRQGELTEEMVADVDSRVAAGTEATVDLTLDAFDGGIAVSGTLSSTWQGECRRCLVDVGGEIEVEVRELFRRGGGDEEGTYPMAEDHINVRELVMDNLFAALPLLPLCQDGCAGICAICGANRNTDPCQCAEPAIDPRWTGLEVLRGQLQAAAPPGAEPAEVQVHQGTVGHETVDHES